MIKGGDHIFPRLVKHRDAVHRPIGFGLRVNANRVIDDVGAGDMHRTMVATEAVERISLIFGYEGFGRDGLRFHRGRLPFDPGRHMLSATRGRGVGIQHGSRRKHEVEERRRQIMTRQFASAEERRYQLLDVPL